VKGLSIIIAHRKNTILYPLMRNFYFKMKIKFLFSLSILAARCSSYNSRSPMYIIVRTSAGNRSVNSAHSVPKIYCGILQQSKITEESGLNRMIEEKLASLGISLPIPPEPAGSYLPVVLSGNLAFVSGQIPTEGKQVKFRGKVDSIEIAQNAARLCTINALAQLKSSLGSLDRIKRFVKVTGFVNCDPSFADKRN
jgi:enamine deaminase RidA (YjgF/YER057c/UK114 family)